MPFVSYAQQREDVILNRVFPGPEGYYVDVGAADPVELSVTKAFSLRGWRGLNVEPQEHYFRLLTEDRPLDTTLRVVCGPERGSLTFYRLPDKPGWSTIDAETVERLKAEGENVVEQTVDCIPLADLLAEHAPEVIDFLKIDVEGAEGAVLAGMDFARFRPRVVVVEATEVGRPDPTHQRFEPGLLDAGYLLAQFDGLNRYYVRREDEAWLPILALPANTFDDYVVYEWLDRAERAERLSAARLELIESLEARTHELVRQLESAESRLAASVPRDALDALEKRARGAEERLAASVPREALDALAGVLARVRSHLHEVRLAAHRAGSVE